MSLNDGLLFWIFNEAFVLLAAQRLRPGCGALTVATTGLDFRDCCSSDIDYRKPGWMLQYNQGTEKCSFFDPKDFFVFFRYVCPGIDIEQNVV